MSSLVPLFQVLGALAVLAVMCGIPIAFSQTQLYRFGRHLETLLLYAVPVALVIGASTAVVRSLRSEESPAPDPSPRTRAGPVS